MTLNGTFTGLPGRLQFTVEVTDGFGAKATIAPTYNLIPHISFPGGSVTCPYAGCNGTLYSQPPKQIPYSGGIGAPTAQVTGWVTSCTYPPCYKPPVPQVSVSGGYVVIYVPPSGGGNGYTAVLTLAVTDQGLCGSGIHCSGAGTVNVVVQSG
jgi:hypothetical protein